MSAIQAGAVTASAFQFLSALDAYAKEAAALTCDRVDPEAYHRMRVGLDEMRRYVQGVPGLSAGWIEVQIRHFELAHVRWKMEQAQAEVAAMQLVAARHDAAVRRLRALCVGLIQFDTCGPGCNRWMCCFTTATSARSAGRRFICSAARCNPPT